MTEAERLFRGRHVVVVLNWFGRADTVRCVSSLIEGSPEVTVLVVDNGSFDGVIDEMTGRASVTTLQLRENLGFAGGMNAGLREAMDGGAGTVTVLNNDTVIPTGTMRVLQQAAGQSRAVSPTVRFRDDPDRVWFGQGALDMPEGYPHHLPPTEWAECSSGLRSSEILAGCCITAAAGTWERVGLFDERFFLNFEDAEWSVRARSVGVELAVSCDAEIFHAVSASFRGAAASLGKYYFLRNGLLFSNLVGAGRLSRITFLRRFGLAGLGRETRRYRSQRLQLLTYAVVDHLRGRYGRAPRLVQHAADRWARKQ